MPYSDSLHALYECAGQALKPRPLSLTELKTDEECLVFFILCFCGGGGKALESPVAFAVGPPKHSGRDQHRFRV